MRSIQTNLHCLQYSFKIKICKWTFLQTQPSDMYWDCVKIDH